MDPTGLELVLECFQIGDDIPDLTRIEPELGHRWVAGDDSLRERFFEVFNRIAFVERAERRRDLQWTLTDFADRMAARTIGLKNYQSPLRCRGEHFVALSVRKCE